MKNLSARIEKILSDKKELGQIGLAKAAEASKSVVNQWISGEIKSMRLDYALNIERNLGYDHLWLVLGQGEEFKKPVAWPFTISYDLFIALPPEERQRLDKHLFLTINDWHQTNHAKSKKTG